MDISSIRKKTVAASAVLLAALLFVAFAIAMRVGEMKDAELPVEAAGDESVPETVTDSKVVIYPFDRNGPQFFLSDFSDKFDELETADLPSWVFGEYEFENRVVLHRDILFAVNGDRVLLLSTEGELLGVSDGDLLSSAKSVVKADNSIFVLGDRRLVEVSLHSHAVIQMYDLPFIPQNTNILVGEKYLWVSHLRGSGDECLLQLDMVRRRVHKRWTCTELGYPTLVNGYYQAVAPKNLVLKKGPGPEIHAVTLNVSEASFIPHQATIINELTSRVTVLPRSQYIELEDHENSYKLEYSGGGLKISVPTLGGDAQDVFTVLREYGSLIRRDEASYYVGSTEGIAVLESRQLNPTLIAESPRRFADTAHLMLGPEERYLVLVEFDFDAVGRTDRSQYNYLVYDTELGRSAYGQIKNVDPESAPYMATMDGDYAERGFDLRLGDSDGSLLLVVGDEVTHAIPKP